jgi:hypothetical protein
VPASRGVITLQWVWRLALLLLVLALVSGGVLLWHGWVAARDGDWRPMDYLLYWVPGLLAAGVGGGLWWVRRRLMEGNRMLENNVDVEAWPSLRRLTVPEFTQMLVLRATSVLALTSSVFMARIRRMVFGLVWNDPAYDGKRVANLIYSMAKPDATLFGRFPWLHPNHDMVKLAETAEAMGTTLWFNKPDEFHMLQRAGEATICFVLLKHIVQDMAARYETPDSDLYDIYTRLREQWDGFNRPVAAAAPSAPPVPKRTGPSIWGT